MKKYLGLIVCLVVGSANASVITNGSFETGDFTGWTTQDLSTPFLPQQVGGAGVDAGFGLFLSAPTDGDFAALNGFDGDGPGIISVSQDITVTSASTITFDYRAGWDMLTFGGSTMNRLFDVNINTTAGVNLVSFNILTAPTGTQILDTGDLTGSVDLLAFIGQTINLSFDWTVPEDFTGPALFQLDNVQSEGMVAVDAPATLALFSLGLLGFRLARKKV